MPIKKPSSPGLPFPFNRQVAADVSHDVFACALQVEDTNVEVFLNFIIFSLLPFYPLKLKNTPAIG
jgi:hypothetical protein